MDLKQNEAREACNMLNNTLATAMNDKIRLIATPVTQHMSRKDTDPLTWCDAYIEQISKRVSGKSRCKASWKQVFSGDSVFLAWAPGIHALAGAILGRPVLYLCWGIPSDSKSGVLSKLKLCRLKLMLRKATSVAVNDEITRKDVAELVKVDPIVIPFLVDTDFFQYADASKRSDYIIVVGDNDRDEALVCELASRGQKIVRVTLSPTVRDYYLERLTPNLELRFRVDFKELRELYQHASVFLLPLRSQNHAAGQTAVLEAIACGTPGVISKGRTSTVCKPYSTVVICEQNNPDTWIAAIENTKSMHENPNDLLRSTANEVAANHNPRVVADMFAEILSKIV